MKKAIVVIILTLLIVASFGFVFLKISANGPESNYFNSKLRYKLARSYRWRNLLGLHYDGDAKADYLGSTYNKILIRVISMEGLYIDQEILDNLAGKIQEITWKKAQYVYAVNQIPFAQSSGLDDLKKQIAGQKKYENRSNSAPLFLVLAYQKKDNATNVGSTLEEDGIVLFEDALVKNYSSNNDVAVFDQYASGVLLHEFGHQIGLPHNNFPDCLMNPSVEINSQERAREILNDFCDYEKSQIKKIIF